MEVLVFPACSSCCQFFTTFSAFSKCKLFGKFQGMSRIIWTSRSQATLTSDFPAVGASSDGKAGAKRIRRLQKITRALKNPYIAIQMRAPTNGLSGYPFGLCLVGWVGRSATIRWAMHSWRDL